MPCLHGNLAKLGGVVPYVILELAVNRLKLTGSKSRKNIGAIEKRGLMYTHVGHACAILVQYLAKLEDTPPNLQRG